MSDPGLKVGRMTWTIWVTWVTFLEGQVGLIRKLNYLDVIRIWKTVLASGKWVNFGFDECTEISLVWNQLIISSCFEACVVQRFHLQKVCAKDLFCILPRMKKSMALFHTKKFHGHITLLLKKVTSTCGSQVGHMWVASGLFCGSLGQMGQQVWPTFNPEWV